jgi:hypothetical protein
LRESQNPLAGAIRHQALDYCSVPFFIRVGQYSAQSNTGLQHETKCKEFKMSQQKIKGLSDKFATRCHSEPAAVIPGLTRNLSFTRDAETSSA